MNISDSLSDGIRLLEDAVSSANPRCTTDSIMKETSHEIKESASDMDNTSTVVRRNPSQCPPTGVSGNPLKRGWTWDNWHRPGWRAPATAPDIVYHRQPPQSAMDSEFCLDKSYPWLLSCSSPEIWYDQVLGLVLNCVRGTNCFLS